MSRGLPGSVHPDLRPAREEPGMNLIGKRILISGGSGLVGHHLRQELALRGAADLVCPRSAECDLRKPGDVEALFRDVKPQLVLRSPLGSAAFWIIRNIRRISILIT